MSLDAAAAPEATKTSQDIQENEDDRELLKLGYHAVLARGWGSYDNFACSFSALYPIGGIRLLFYIAISGGGPAAM